MHQALLATPHQSQNKAVVWYVTQTVNSEINSILFVLDRVSLCSPDRPRTHYVDQAEHKLTELLRPCLSSD